MVAQDNTDPALRLARLERRIAKPWWRKWAPLLAVLATVATIGPAAFALIRWPFETHDEANTVHETLAEADKAIVRRIDDLTLSIGTKLDALPAAIADELRGGKRRGK